MQYQADAFKAHHDSHGNLFADWNLAFSNWLRKSVEFAKSKHGYAARQDDARYGRVAEKHLITNEDVDADQEWLRQNAPGMVVG